MSPPLSVALLGLWHVHATDYARAVDENTDTRLSVVWDSDTERGRAGAEALGVEFIADLDAVLARSDIDAVIVTTATADHYDVLTAAARAGKHIFTEKLLAPTVDEAEQILNIVERHDVTLVVSLPRLSEATTVAIRRILSDGKLGSLTYTRVRMAHNGWIGNWLPERFANREEAIGGALTDLGAHPAYLTQLFLGPQPSTVSARYTSVTGRDVEDNAAVTLTYPNGAIGVFEASFVTTPGAFTLELRGTEGSILYGFGSERLLVKGDHFDPESWQELELPPADADPFRQWVDHIRTGTVAHENLTAALELTRLIVAANRAAASGAAVDYEVARP